MARLRRMLAPINTVKHYVHLANTAIASGSLLAVIAVQAVVAPATANAFSVKEGSLVKTIFYEMWVLNQGVTATNTKFTLTIEKVPSGLASVLFADVNNLGAYDNKKNILYHTQGVISGEDTASVPIIRGWLQIPKGKQRMGRGDRIVMSITTLGQVMAACGFFTYKEWT